MTTQVRRFLVQFAGLGASARARIVERYLDLSSQRAFALAEQALAETIVQAGRIAEQDALAGPLLQLVGRERHASHDQTGDATDVGSTSDDDVAHLDKVAEPALAAVLALLVADVLLPSVATTLYAPVCDEIAWPLSR